VSGPRDLPRETPGDDAVWREIVANYGERPAIDAEEDTRVDQQAQRGEPREDVEPREPGGDAELTELAGGGWHEERFVPPPPPPLPRVSKDRLAAWLGVFVSPVLLLFATVLRIPLPTIVAWLLVAAFLGGFGYLVAQMPRGPRDPFDDGARL
jgi:hypothetical protein